MEYRENNGIRLHVRMCAALAFLKPENVLDGWVDGWTDGWMDGGNTLSSSRKSQTLLRTGQITQEFPIEMWKRHQARRRTTSVVKGWNNRLNNLVGRPHPKLKEVVEVLKTEAEKTNCAFVKTKPNMEGNKIRRKYVKQDGRFENI